MSLLTTSPETTVHHTNDNDHHNTSHWSSSSSRLLVATPPSPVSTGSFADTAAAAAGSESCAHGYISPSVATIHTMALAHATSPPGTPLFQHVAPPQSCESLLRLVSATAAQRTPMDRVTADHAASSSSTGMQHFLQERADQWNWLQHTKRELQLALALEQEKCHVVERLLHTTCGESTTKQHEPSIQLYTVEEGEQYETVLPIHQHNEEEDEPDMVPRDNSKDKESCNNDDDDDNNNNMENHMTPAIEVPYLDFPRRHDDGSSSFPLYSSKNEEPLGGTTAATTGMSGPSLLQTAGIRRDAGYLASSLLQLDGIVSSDEEEPASSDGDFGLPLFGTDRALDPAPHHPPQQEQPQQQEPEDNSDTSSTSSSSTLWMMTMNRMDHTVDCSTWTMSPDTTTTSPPEGVGFKQHLERLMVMRQRHYTVLDHEANPTRTTHSPCPTKRMDVAQPSLPSSPTNKNTSVDASHNQAIDYLEVMVPPSPQSPLASSSNPPNDSPPLQQQQSGVSPPNSEPSQQQSVGFWRGLFRRSAFESSHHNSRESSPTHPPSFLRKASTVGSLDTPVECATNNNTKTNLPYETVTEPTAMEPVSSNGSGPEHDNELLLVAPIIQPHCDDSIREEAPVWHRIEPEEEDDDELVLLPIRTNYQCPEDEEEDELIPPIRTNCRPRGSHGILDPHASSRGDRSSGHGNNNNNIPYTCHATTITSRMRTPRPVSPDHKDDSFYYNRVDADADVLSFGIVAHTDFFQTKHH